MGTVNRFCNKALLLNEGKIQFIGDPREAAMKYNDLNKISIDLVGGNDEDGIDMVNDSVKQKIELHIYRHGEKKSPTGFMINEEADIDLSWTQRAIGEIMILDMYTKSGQPVTVLHVLKKIQEQ
jgi:ABC-type multidrug transport system ATPase subunit